MVELERRGYLQAGAFVPEVVIEYPDLVKGLHEEFVHNGSDILVALTVEYLLHLREIITLFVIILQ